MDKIAALTEILNMNPADSFARYGLAMAYAAEGKLDEALAQYSETTDRNPDYVPAYQMSAQTLLKLAPHRRSPHPPQSRHRSRRPHQQRARHQRNAGDARRPHIASNPHAPHHIYT